MRLFLFILAMSVLLPLSVQALVTAPGEAPLQSLPAGIAPNVSRNVEYHGEVPVESTATPVNLPNAAAASVSESGQHQSPLMPSIPVAAGGYGFRWILVVVIGFMFFAFGLWFINRQTDQ
jgi:hypothetical protein